MIKFLSFSLYLISYCVAQNQNNFLAINCGYSIANSQSTATNIRLFNVGTEYGKRLISKGTFSLYAILSSELQMHRHLHEFTSGNGYRAYGISKNNILQVNGRFFLRNVISIPSTSIVLFADLGLEMNIYDLVKIEIQDKIFKRGYFRYNLERKPPLIVRSGVAYNLGKSKKYSLGLFFEYHLAKYYSNGIRYEYEQSHFTDYDIFFMNSSVSWSF